MIDIQSYILAAKAAWIPRLISMTGNWTAIPVHSFDDIGLRFTDILRSNIHDSRKIPSFLKLPPFYIDCIVAFNKCKRSYKKTESDDLLSECIWLNDKFLFKNKHLYLKNWVESGFIYLKDFFNMEGKLLSWEQIQDKLHDKRNWIAETYKIFAAIKTYLKILKTSNAKFVKIPNKIYLKTRYRQVLIHNQRLKFFYELLIDKKYERPITEKFWERKFNIDLQSRDWKEIYRNKVHNSVERKLSELNYKLLNRILPCNFWLKKCKIKDSENCEYCGGVETLEHLYFDCERVKNLWNLIGKTFKVKLNFKRIVLGYYWGETSFTVSLNGIISIVLFTIYKHWCINRENKDHFLTCCLSREIKAELQLRKEMQKYMKGGDNLLISKLIQTL